MLKLRKHALSLNTLALIHIDQSIQEFAQVVLGINPFYVFIAFLSAVSTESSPFSPLVEHRYKSNTFRFSSPV